MVLFAALLNFKTVYVCPCRALGPLSPCRAHILAGGLSTQQISRAVVVQRGWALHPLVRIMMLIFRNNGAACQDGPCVECGVHYRPCDGSAGGEQRALRTECPVTLVNRTKIVLYCQRK